MTKSASAAPDAIARDRSWPPLRRTLLLGGLIGAVLGAPQVSEAVLLVDNGVASDAIGGYLVRSAGLASAIRTADSVTVTGQGDTTFTTYSMAGTSRIPGGPQGDISLINFHLAIYTGNSRWDSPLFDSAIAPANANFSNSLGNTALGYAVYGLQFDLRQFGELQNLAPGNYRVAIYGLTNGTNAAGEFSRVTSRVGVGVVGNTYADGIGFANWTSTTTIGPDYADKAINGRLEAVPEPATIVALGFGALAMLRLRNRRA